MERPTRKVISQILETGRIYVAKDAEDKLYPEVQVVLNVSFHNDQIAYAIARLCFGNAKRGAILTSSVNLSQQRTWP